MAFEQFCLKWNNFQSNILTAFESLQATEDLADVTLACDGTTIKAHKFILSACSPYFRTIFKENPCSHPVVILKDVFYSDLIALLNFMYHGEVMVSKEQLQTFLKTAEVLQVSGLKSLPDLCQKIKHKRIIQEIEPESIKKPRKDERNENRSDKVEDKRDRQPVIQEPAPIPVDHIKIEAEDIPSDMESISEKIEPTEKDKSLLEAALEVKEAPSILERSLTSHTAKNNITETKCEIIPRKPPEDSKRDVDDSDHMTNSNDSMGNGNIGGNCVTTVPVGGVHTGDPPVHHSSQCGTCPHCGLPFTNQSSLKYHVRLVHSELLNLYCCHLCPLTFGFRYGYKKHMADVHSVRT